MGDARQLVLLVEDNRADARLIEILFEEAGDTDFRLERVGRLDEAIARVRDGGIGAALLDLGLPDSTGRDTLLALQCVAPSLPIVVLTGLDDDQVASQAVRLGAQDYLVKGRVDGASLVRSLRYAIERQKRIDAERRLADTESRYHLLFEQSPDAMVVIDLETLLPLQANAAACRQFSITRDASGAPGAARRDSSHPCAEVGRRVRAAVAEGEHCFEVTYRDGSGVLRCIEASVCPVDADGRPAALTICRDVTARRLGEELHRVRERLLDFSGDHTLDELLRRTLDEVCALVDSPVGFYHFVNEDQQTLTLQAWSTRTLKEFCRAEGKGHHYGIDEAGVWVDCVREGRPVVHNDYASLSHRKGLPEGHAPVVREMVVPIYRRERLVAILGVGNKPQDYTDDDVEAVSFLADIAWEIAERKRGEESLARQAAIIDGMPYLVATVRADGRMLTLNPAGRRLVGIGEDFDVTGRRWPDFLSAAASEQMRGETETALQEAGLWSGETVLMDAWGEEIAAEMVVLAHGDQAGQREYLSVIANDIRERRRLNAELRQSQKMEAIGRLAGGIAHDFNNLLTPILTYGQLLQDRVGSDPRLQRYAEQIVRTAERAAALPRQLLIFSRRQVLVPSVLNLNAVVSDMGRMLERSLGEDVTIEGRPGLGLWPIKADLSQIEQVILNLAVNARDAMPGGGQLTVETANVVIDGEYARLHPGVPPGDYVQMAVSDTGCGMSKEVREHIFEPFFTTKEAGKGTGLGLATVYGIVAQSGGFIRVYSEVGHGTTFRIYLPRTAEDAVPKETVVDTMPAGGNETVLVVEDDDFVRASVCEMLKELGYRVLQAEGGEAALALLEDHQGAIDLLLTDVVMPAMDGRQVAEQVVAARPTIRVLYMSGYTENAILHSGALDPGIILLQKPFGVGALARKLRAVLDARP